MKIRNVLYGVFIFLSINTFGQLSPEYKATILQASQQYDEKAFLQAAQTYSMAFSRNNNRGLINHRYNAARCWILAGLPDSAFYQLEKIANSGFYINYVELTTEPAFESLHSKPQWIKVIDRVKINKEKAEENFNKPLVAILDSVYHDDQDHRDKRKEVEQKYGTYSIEYRSHLKLISSKDSINQIRVEKILDKYGFLGEDVVGEQGSSALFLVILHADIATQKKYLPMLRAAVTQRKIWPSNLALLEDKVALSEGKKQIYGSQIGKNIKTGKYYVLPLEDPQNVDQRRLKVQLSTISEYLSNWGIIWSIEQYNKGLTENK